MTGPRLLAFGEAGPGTWGVTWIPEPGSPAQLGVRRGADAIVLDAALAGTAPDEAWRLEGEEVSLILESTGSVGRGGASDVLQTSDQLCTVTGRVQIAGAAVEVHSPGWRSTVQVEPDLSAVGSFRWVAGWLGANDSFSLLALRPRRARGHDADLLAATLIDDPLPPRVEDPRLSTTYTEAGLPARVGLELWFEAAAADGSDESPPPQYPRRAAGEILGSGLAWKVSDFALHASPVQWHSHGHDGAGIYLLARRT